MTAAEAVRHLKYSAWASRGLVDAMKQISADDARRDVGISHRSIFGTLQHIYFADLIWFSRTVDPTVKVHSPSDVLTDTELEHGWAHTQQRWIDWAASLSDADLNRIVDYKSLKGDPFQNTAGEIVMHVVNHATIHRGQVMGMLRQMGVAPPPTDLIFYYREPS
jgi:uncharacterized damage-inducible protein DinB